VGQRRDGRDFNTRRGKSDRFNRSPGGRLGYSWLLERHFGGLVMSQAEIAGTILAVLVALAMAVVGVIIHRARHQKDANR